MDDADLRATLLRLLLAARSDLRRLLFASQADRDRIGGQLLRRRTESATDLADLLDTLSIDNAARRRVVRVLGEMEANR
jgi:hypothetical protein